jgi:hypothetical protein
VFAAADAERLQFTTFASLSASPDGKFIAFAYTPGEVVPRDVWVVNVATGKTTLVASSGEPLLPGWTPTSQHGVEDVQWSADGTFITFTSINGRARATATLANLSTSLTAYRKAGGGALVIEGTAQDLNFDHYRLTARAAGTTSAGVEISSGVSAVVGGVLGEWTPPAPGLYEISLQTFDKAGNARVKTTTAGWTSTPAMVSLAASPAYISPNGDGAQDSTTLTYVTTTPLSTQVSVRSSAGTVVQSYRRTNASAGSFSVVWDGRDQGGQQVPDGTYSVVAESLLSSVTVDTVAPVVQLSLADPTLGTPFIHTTRTGFDRYGLPRTFESLAAARVHQATDANLSSWLLETSTDAAPQAFTPLSTGSSGDLLDEGAPLSAVRGRHFRLRAVDLAGNSAVTAVVTYPEQLFLTALGDVAAIDASYGALLVDGQTLPRIDQLGSAQVASNFGFTPRVYAFALETSVALPLVSYAVAYRPHGSTAPFFVDTANVQQLAETVIAWDARTLAGQAFDLEIRATDTQGRVFTLPIQLSYLARKANLEACLDTADAIRASVSVSVAPGESMPELSAGSHLEVLTANRAVAASWPLDTPALPVTGGAQFFASSAYSTGLADCAYTASASGSLTDGETLVGAGPINLCSTRARSASFDGRQLVLSLSEHFSEPITGVDVLLRLPGGLWQLAGSTPAFSGQATFSLDLPGLGTCGRHELRLVTHLASGLDSDSLTTNAFECLPLAQVDVPCTQALIALGTPPAPAPDCAPQTAPTPVAIQAVSAEGVTISSLQAWVQTPSGAAQWTLPVQGFTPGGANTALSVDVPLADLPDGLYVVGVSMTDSLGLTVRAVGPSLPLVADHTPPSVTLASIPSASHVCLSSASGANGATQRPFQVSGTVADQWLTSYSLLVTPAGGPSRTILLKDFGTAGPESVSGTLGTADLSLVSNGDASVALLARDVSGGSACSPPQPVHFESGASLSGVSVSPAVVSPDNDGVSDVGQLSLALSEAGSLVVSATASGGTATQLFSGAVPSGAFSRALSLAGLPDGPYVVGAHLQTSCGNVADGSTTLSVDTQPPTARIDSPVASAVVSGSVPITGLAADAHFASYELSLGQGATPSTFTVLSTFNTPANGPLGTLETGSLAAGTWVVRLVVRDSVGHATEVRRAVQVTQPLLLTAFSLQDAAVSPNGDGHQDTTTAVGSLRAAATLSLDLLDAQGHVVATPASAAMGSGPFSVPLPATLLTGLADGTYTVRASAAAGAVTETAIAVLVLDRVPPLVALTSPADGAWLQSSTGVALSVTGANIWALRHTVGTAAPVLVTGGLGDATGPATTLSDLAEGTHRLTLEASDRAGNSASTTVSFTVDTTPPAVAFTSPLSGDFISGARGAIPITATVSDASTTRLQLTRIRGATTSSLVTLSALPASAPLALWDASGEPDGPERFQLVVTDAAGNVSTATIDTTLDSTPPIAALTSPTGTLARAAVVFSGTATDTHFKRYSLSFAAGASPATAFTELSTSTNSVTGGALATPHVLPADGTSTFRLTVEDEAGNTSTADTVATLASQGSQPQPAPSGFTATVVPLGSVQLTWAQASGLGYHLTRTLLTGGGTVSVGGLLAVGSYLDGPLADGTYQYRLVAVDAAGFEGAPTMATVVIDASAPSVSLTSPSSGGRAGGLVDVIGTASGGAGFTGYEVTLEGTRVATGSAPVVGGRLGQLDLRAIADGTAQHLQLTGHSTLGGDATATVQFTVDNTPPAAPVLVNAFASGSTASITWQPSASPDVLGYLVLRNEQVATAPSGSSAADLRPSLLPATTTSLQQLLPDGAYTFVVVAVDQAMNLSPRSNSRVVTVETRAPQATIVSPTEDSIISGVTQLLADSADSDVASVQFEVQPAGAPGFVALGSPVTRAPFATAIDPSTLGPGEVLVRAVATDFSGHTDAAPAALHLSVAQPMPAAALTALVDGATVRLSWPGGPGLGSVVWRDGVELAPGGASAAAGGATVSSSSTSAGNAAAPWNADCTMGCRLAWATGDVGGTTWAVRFAEPLLEASFSAEGYWSFEPTVEWLQGGRWVAQSPTLPSSLSQQVVRLAPEGVVEGVRLVFPGGGDLYSASSIGRSLAQATSFSDAFVDVGTHAYSVTVYDRSGLSTQARATARIYAPTLDAPEVNATAVQGHQATPGATVTLVDSATQASVGTAVANAAGDFSMPVSLPADTSRSVFAVAVDPLGNRSLPSALVGLRSLTPLSTQVVLALTSVNSNEVTLSAHLVGDSTGVTNVALWRQGGGQSATQVGSNVPGQAFVDLVTEGTYQYFARAGDWAGRVGPVSNLVSATVQATTAAPLHLTAMPAQGVIHLAWTGATATAYVERGPTALGPFSFIGQSSTPATTFDDANVHRGAEYYYRVRIDSAPLLSPYSEVVGTQLPPRAPVFLSPADQRQVGSATVVISGYASVPGSVELMRGEQRLVVARAFADGGQPGFTAIPAGSIGTPAVPDTGLSGDIDPTSLTPSPDGQWLAGVISQPAGDGATSRHVFVTDMSSSATHLLTQSPTAGDEEFGPLAWSPDSTALSYAGSRSGSMVIASNGLYVYSEVLLGPVDGYGVKALVSVNGGSVVAQLATPDSEVLRRLPANQDVWTAYRLSGLVRSDTGSFIAASESNDAQSWDSVVVDLSTNSATLLDDSGAGPRLVALSPDGTRLASAGAGRLCVSEAPFDPQTACFSGASSAGGHLTWGAEDAPSYVSETGTKSLLRFGYPFSATVPLLSGDNLLTARSLTALGVKSDESAPLHVVAPEVQAPDLAVAGLVVSPAVALPGDAAQVLVTLTNRGSADADTAAVRVTLVGTDGTSRSAPVVSPSVATLAPQQSTGVAVPLDLSGLVGEQLVVAVVDADEQTADADRTNNRATASITVAANSSLAMTLTATTSPLQLEARVNVFSPRTAQVGLTSRISVVTADGTVIAALSPDENIGALAAGSAWAFTRTLSLSELPSGTYQTVAELRSNGVLVDTQAQPLTVTHPTSATLSLASTRNSYLEGEPAVLRALVRNTGGADPLESAQLRLTVQGPSASTSTLSLATLAPASSAAETFTLPTLAPGAYGVTCELLVGAGVAASSQTSFRVVSQPRLTGSVDILGAVTSPALVGQGQPVVASATVSNLGGAVASQVTLTASLLDTTTGTIVAQASTTPADVAAGATTTASLTLQAALERRLYAVTLSASIAGAAAVQLASTQVRIVDGTPPSLQVPGLGNDAVVAPSLVLSVGAQDVSGVATVRVSVDGAAPVALGLSEGTSADGRWAGTLALPSSGYHTLTVSAVDQTGQDGLLSPTADDPLTVRVVVDGRVPSRVEK